MSAVKIAHTPLSGRLALIQSFPLLIAAGSYGMARRECRMRGGLRCGMVVSYRPRIEVDIIVVTDGSSNHEKLRNFIYKMIEK